LGAVVQRFRCFLLHHPCKSRHTGAGGGASPPVGGEGGAVGCGVAGVPESGGGGGMSDGGVGDGVPPGAIGALVQPNAKNRSAATPRMAANVASFMSMPP